MEYVSRMMHVDMHKLELLDRLFRAEEQSLVFLHSVIIADCGIAPFLRNWHRSFHCIIFINVDVCACIYNLEGCNIVCLPSLFVLLYACINHTYVVPTKLVSSIPFMIMTFCSRGINCLCGMQLLRSSLVQL